MIWPAEPKKLRYRLLHVGARIARTARPSWLYIPDNWPWATELITAFTRLAGLLQPLTRTSAAPLQHPKNPARLRATTMSAGATTAQQPIPPVKINHS